MFDEVVQDSRPMDEDDGFELLQEMERNTPEEIRRRRAGFRYPIKATVTLQPGNASQLLDFKIQGVTGDISIGGLSALFPLPVNVGDIYRLELDRSQIDIPLTFARCVKCVLVWEGAYNCGFRFFADITLPENIEEVAAEIAPQY